MTDADILATLLPVFRNVFDNDALMITPETAIDDIAGCDSMVKVTLAVEVEHCFGVKFKTSEMEALGEVGDLIKLVSSRQRPGLS